MGGEEGGCTLISETSFFFNSRGMCVCDSTHLFANTFFLLKSSGGEGGGGDVAKSAKL